MTDRLAALERVAEAARRLRVTINEDRAHQGRMIAIRDYDRAVDALPAEPVGERWRCGEHTPTGATP